MTRRFALAGILALLALGAAHAAQVGTYVAPVPNGNPVIAFPANRSTSIAACFQGSAVAGNLYSVSAINNSGSQAWLTMYDATTTPVANPVTPLTIPYLMAAGASQTVTWNPGPPKHVNTGLMVCLSSTTAFTFTGVSFGQFSVDFQPQITGQ